MKLKSILFLLLSAMILTTSCSKDDDDDDNNGGGGVTLTGVTLDKSALSVKVGSTATLVATLNPTGATGTVNWSSDKPAIATVSGGTVTGVAEGTAVITASVGSFSATCTITVSKDAVVNPGDNQASLKGTNYYLIFLDATSHKKISASNIKQDLRPDEATAVLDIWPSGDSYTSAPTSGPNFYGEVEGWIALTANAAPWAGVGAGGIREIKNFDLTAVDGTYTFHVAYKSKDGGKNELALFTADGGEVWFTLPAQTDGEWHEFEVPMSTLISQGWSFNRPYTLAGDGQNVLGFRTTGAGKTLEVDAIFIYKK